MFIQKIIDRNRRDFTAIYECQFCGHELKQYGYDDSYFHNVAIPNMECPECGKSTSSHSTNDNKPPTLQPRYPDDMTV